MTNHLTNEIHEQASRIFGKIFEKALEEKEFRQLASQFIGEMFVRAFQDQDFQQLAMQYFPEFSQEHIDHHFPEPVSLPILTTEQETLKTIEGEWDAETGILNIEQNHSERDMTNMLELPDLSPEAPNDNFESGDSGEMSDDDLEQVAGGLGVTFLPGGKPGGKP